jgi:hypothetical protein
MLPRKSLGHTRANAPLRSREDASRLPTPTRTVDHGSAVRAFFLWASVASVLFGVLRPAGAEEKKTVVVLDIQGGNKKLQDALVKALQDKYTVLPVSKWNTSAKKLGVSAQGTDEVAMVAADIKADAVVTGKVKQDKDGGGGWQLNIAARQGTSGKPIGKIRKDLKSQKVDAGTIAEVESEIAGAVQLALDGPPPEPMVSANPTEPAPAQTLGKEEDPLEKMRKEEERLKAERESSPRPVWYPYVDANVGFNIHGRSFAYNEEAGTSAVKCYEFKERGPDMTDPAAAPVYTYDPALKSCPKYAPSVTGGIRIDVTGYPLAFLRPNPVRGLGIGVTFDYFFWPPSKTGGINSQDLATSEFNFEVGLRYHYNILNKRSRPSILANLQYGGHGFSVQKQEKTYSYKNEITFAPEMTKGIDDHGLPDIFYQYITIGVGARVPYYATEKMFFGLLVNLNFHALLSYGEISTTFSDTSTVNGLYQSGGYGPTQGGYGLRATFTPLEAMLWRGLTLRVAGVYEMFSYKFTLGSGGGPSTSIPPINRSQQNAARHIAQGALDQYFGGVITIGYQY